jgi:hypothetical protein
MIETGVVINKLLRPIHWHLPPGRSGGALPDSLTLWDVIWDQFQEGMLFGFAHSHPGSGVPGPSYTDVTTFAAIEAALGTRIYWWITSDTHVVRLEWRGPDKLSYAATIVEAPSWVDELRRLSQQGQGQGP